MAGLGPVDAVGHRIVHGGPRYQRPVRIDAEVVRALDRALRARAAAPGEVAGGARSRWRRARRRAGGRVLRHGLSRDAARGGAHLRPAADVARALGPAPLRLPRSRPRLGGAAGRRAARPAARRTAARHLSPRRRCVAGRRAGRSLGRHDDGLHAARRPGHGHALGQRRPRIAAVAPRAHRPERGGVGARARARLRAAGARRRRPTCARSCTRAEQGEARAILAARGLHAPPARGHRRDGRRDGRPRRARLLRRRRRARRRGARQSGGQARLPRRRRRPCRKRRWQR